QPLARNLDVEGTDLDRGLDRRTHRSLRGRVRAALITSSRGGNPSTLLLPLGPEQPRTSAVGERERDRIAVVEAERLAQVDLAEELELVGGIAEPCRLDGLKGDSPVAIGDDHPGEEVAGLAGPLFPVWCERGSRHVPPGRASFERSGQAYVQRAWHDRTSGKLSESLDDLGVRHQRRPQPASGLDDAAEIASGQRRGIMAAVIS